jgi:hypothetical protein
MSDMSQKKNPGSAGTLHGTGMHTPAVSDGACPQEKRPDVEAIWDACRQARDADASRKARNAARAREAALTLGRFKQDESGRWAYQCPDCQQTLALSIAKNGVRASSFGQTICPTELMLQQWLRDNGFQL